MRFNQDDMLMSGEDLCHGGVDGINSILRNIVLMS